MPSELRGRAPRATRPAGLRRQFRAALSLMVGVLVLSLAGVFVSYLQVVNHYRAAADGLGRAITLSSQLTDQITGHEALAHTLWNGDPVDRGLYLTQQAQIVALIQSGATQLHSPDEQALLTRAAQLWRNVYVSRGLWGPSAGPRPGVTLVEEQQFGSDSDAVTVTLSQLTKAAIAVGSRQISGAHGLQRILVGLLVGLFALVFAVTAYFARRMSIDILRPIEFLHAAVIKLREGNLQHRVELPTGNRQNELSELADAINTMAFALDQSHRDLSHQASHDVLTGLVNRAEFGRELGLTFRSVNQRDRDGLAVLFVDVDDFKLINDSLGHAAGDALLIGVARRLSTCVRGRDVVARLGGDEFALLVTDKQDGPDQAVTVAQRLLEALTPSFSVAGHEASVTVSIGIAVRDRLTPSPDELIAEADFAMYAAKAQGKGRYQLYDASMRDAVTAGRTEYHLEARVPIGGQ